ncbi:MAG: Phosphatidylserine decarboxylase proenzyme [Catillopecten margaritatus gill symbiont]|uniref:phosphatidylserine decarboxylase n=1 Tax=Catillopecten margaritatus gill symbiont TaxID=3083288 RepID=A0AAU6PI51_9GAMM
MIYTGKARVKNLPVSVVLQYFLPQHWLSKLMFRFARIKNRWIKNKFTHWFVKTYKVDLSQAKREKVEDYVSFNDFFTRSLKVGVRPIGEGLISPVDGVVSQAGKIENGDLIQAKGKKFTLKALLGNNEKFQNFATIYLSPSDYHRIHAPLDGKLLKMDYIGGDLFSVNNQTAHSVDNLFARNERVVCYFDTYAIVLVGAIFVGSMETVWHGQITPPYGKCFSVDYTNKDIYLKKGEELGRFNMGSTVILLSNTYQFDSFGQVVKMGQSLSI